MTQPTPFNVIMGHEAKATGQITCGYLLGVRAMGIDTLLMAPTAEEVQRMAQTVAATLGGAIFGAEPREAVMMKMDQLDFGMTVTEVGIDDWNRAVEPGAVSPSAGE